MVDVDVDGVGVGVGVDVDVDVVKVSPGGYYVLLIIYRVSYTHLTLPTKA